MDVNELDVNELDELEDDADEAALEHYRYVNVVDDDGDEDELNEMDTLVEMRMTISGGW